MTTFIVGDPDSTPDAGDVLVYANERYVPGKPVDTTNFVDNDDSRLSDERNPTEHDHTISSVDGLQAALDGKQDAGAYLTETDLNGYANETYVNNTVDDAVDGLASTEYVDTAVSGVDIPDVSDFITSDALNDYATKGYVDSAIDDIPETDLSGLATTQDLNDGLAGKADASALAGKADVSALDGKADTGHTHVIADVDGLQDALDNAGGSAAQDTGWRSITHLLSDKVEVGSMGYRRIGNIVYLGAHPYTPSVSGLVNMNTDDLTLITLPEGIRPSVLTNLPKGVLQGVVDDENFGMELLVQMSNENPSFEIPDGMHGEEVPYHGAPYVITFFPDLVNPNLIPPAEFNFVWAPGGSWITDDPFPADPPGELWERT